MEYKAISQASYKFTSTRETTIQGADVLNSGFRFGTIKTTDNMVLQLLPSYGTNSYTTQGINFKWRSISSSSSAESSAYCNGYLYPVTVDGKIYYGTKSARFCLGNPSSFGAYGPATLTLKDGMLKVLRYDNLIQTIVLDEYSTDNRNTDSPSSGSNHYSYCYLDIYKQTDDVILAVWWEETTTTTSE